MGPTDEYVLLGELHKPIGLRQGHKSWKLDIHGKCPNIYCNQWNWEKHVDIAYTKNEETRLVEYRLRLQMNN